MLSVPLIFLSQLPDIWYMQELGCFYLRINGEMPELSFANNSSKGTASVDYCWNRHFP